MKSRNLFPGLLLIFSLASCSLWDLNSPFVSASAPSPEATGVATNATVQLTFSKPMDLVTTEKSFSFTANNQAVSGKIKWLSPSNLSFTPDQGLDTGSQYQAALTTEAEDVNGNNLGWAFSLRFTTTGNPEIPKLVSMTPADRSTGSTPTNIVRFQFNLPVDLQSFKDSFTFSPSPGHLVQYGKDESEILVYFKENLSYGNKYTVSIGTGLKGKNGKNLRETYNAYFYLGTDFTPPLLLNLSTSLGKTLSDGSTVTNVEKSETLLFSFSKSMSGQSVESAVTFSPYISGEWTWSSASESVFKPDSPLGIETTYRVVVADTFEDLYKNKATNKSTFWFTVNGPNSRAVSLTNVSDATHSTAPQNSVITPPTYSGLSFHFSARMNTSSVAGAISASRVSGTGGASIDIVVIAFQDSDARLVLNLGSLSPGNIYKITIRGGSSGVKDKNNNAMTSDFVFYFQT